MYIGISDIMYRCFLCISDIMHERRAMGDFNQAKYIQEYQKEKYDRCIFNVPKGQKAVIEKHWKAKGYKSLNTYVNDLITKDMAEEQSRPKP